MSKAKSVVSWFTLAVLVVVLFSSCATARFSVARSFEVSNNTKVFVEAEYDPFGLAFKLENELLNRGVPVAPIESMQRELRTASNLSVTSSSKGVSGQAESSISVRNTIPTHILVSIRYTTYNYPAIAQCYIRVVDLLKNETIASYSYSRSWWALRYEKGGGISRQFADEFVSRF